MCNPRRNKKCLAVKINYFLIYEIFFEIYFINSRKEIQKTQKHKLLSEENWRHLSKVDFCYNSNSCL